MSRDTYLIKLSPKHDDDFARQTVHDRTLELHKFEAGNLINLGYTLAWLSENEAKKCLDYYKIENEKYEKQIKEV